MMGINNPPGWFSDKVGLGDTTRYKFVEDDHVNVHDNDKYYWKMIDSAQGDSAEDKEAVLNSYYSPLNELDGEELTKRWTILNKTDAAGNHIISDNYYSLSNGSTLNYNKDTMDRILEDIIDSKVPGEKDLIPEAFPDYEDLNALNEVRRLKRSVAN